MTLDSSTTIDREDDIGDTSQLFKLKRGQWEKLYDLLVERSLRKVRENDPDYEEQTQDMQADHVLVETVEEENQGLDYIRAIVHRTALKAVKPLSKAVPTPAKLVERAADRPQSPTVTIKKSVDPHFHCDFHVLRKLEDPTYVPPLSYLLGKPIKGLLSSEGQRRIPQEIFAKIVNLTTVKDLLSVDPKTEKLRLKKTLLTLLKEAELRFLESALTEMDISFTRRLTREEKKLFN